MPGNVDQRIVQMRFENDQFERNIAKSKRSLADFKKELNFSEVSRGMFEFFEKTRDFSFEKLANGVQALADRFTGLGNVAEMVTHQIRQRVEGVIASMSRFADSMTTAQIAAGKEKYEMLNKSVQTIKNATGKSEDEVYAVLEKLNRYTDQTSYDFADMATNIGKFTSVGRDLAESERAMEGIANWAALSGAGTAEASRAMYNISQAMGMGKMMSRDWLSIQNAGMATIEFKNAAIEAAVATGDLVKTTDKSGKEIYKTAKKYGKQVEVSATKGWDDFMSKGAFTNDVMIKVLEQFGDTSTELGKKAYEAAQKCTTFTDVIKAWKDQISTGWMNSFRHIFGDLTESMNFFSDVCNKVADDISVLIDARNTILKGWSELGGRKDLFSILLGDYGDGVETGAYSLIDMLHDLGSLISEAFWDLLKPFAKDSVQGLWDKDDGQWRLAWLSVELKKLTGSVKRFMQSIKTFFTEEQVFDDGTVTTRGEMIANVLRGIAGAFIYAFNIIQGIVAFFHQIRIQLTPMFLSIEYLFSQLGASIYESAGQENKKKGILGFFLNLAELSKPLTAALTEVVNKIIDVIFKIIDWGKRTGIFSKIGNALKEFYNTAVKVLTPLLEFIGHVFEIISDLFNEGFNLASLKKAGEKLKVYFSIMLKGIADALPESMKWLKEAIYDLFGLWEPEQLIGRNTIFTKLHDFLQKGFGAIGEWFNDGTFSNIWQKIKEFFKGGGESVEGAVNGVLDWFKDLSLGEAIKKGVGGLIDIIGKLINMLGNTNLWTLAKAIIGTIAAFKVYNTIKSAGSVMDAIKDFFENPFAKLKEGLFGGGDDEPGLLSQIVDKILDVAKAIGIMVAAIVILGALPTDQLIKGGLSMIAIMGMMVGFIAAVNAVSGVGLKSSINYIAIAGVAIGLGLMVAALLPLTLVSWEGLGKMMAGLGGILLQLIGLMLITSYLPIGTKQLGGFIGFALSIAILVYALLPLAAISWEGYAKMMAVLGGILLQLIGVMLITSYVPIGTGQLGGFIAFAASIAILVLTLLPLASISWEGYAKMMAGLGGILLQLIGFMLLTSYLPIGTGQLGGFIGFAASIAILVLTLLPLANMTWEGYAKMMAGLGGVLLSLVLFSFLMKRITLDPGAVAGALVFAGALSVMMLAFGASLSMVKGFDWGTILAFAGGLTVLLIGMSSAIAILAAIPFTSAIKGIALMGLALTALITVLSITLPMLAEAVGESLTDVMSRLELVSGMITGFADKMGGVDEGSIDKANGIFDKLKAMMQKLVGWGKFTGTLDDFSYTMFALGSGMEIFDYHVGNVIGSVDGDADAALDFLMKLSACVAPLTALAATDMNGLIGKISALGGALYIFAKGSKEAEGIEIGENPDISGGLRIIQALAAALNENGGFTIPENMPKEDELSTFGAELAALAAALVLFEEAGKGLGSGTEQALKTLDFFQQLKTKLVETEFAKNLGTTIGIFDENKVKKDDLTQFGTNIEQLGLALKAFAASVTVIDEETGEMKDLNFDNAIKALESFAALEGSLGIDFGPLLRLIIGRRRDLGDLGAEIELLGTALSDFCGKLSGVDEQGNPKFNKQLFDDALEVARQISGYLTELNTQFDTVGGLVNIVNTVWNGRKFDFSDLKTQMTALGDGLRSLDGIDITGEEKNTVSGDDFTKEGGIGDLLDAIIAYMHKLEGEFGNVGGAYDVLNTLWNGREFTFVDLQTQLQALGDGLRGLSGINTTEENKILSVDDLKKEGGIFDLLDALISYMNGLDKKTSNVGGVYDLLNTALNGRKFNFVDLETQLVALGNGLRGLSGINTTDENRIFSAEEFSKEGGIADLLDEIIVFMNSLEDKVKNKVGGAYNGLDIALHGRTFDFTDLRPQLIALGDGLTSLSNVNVDTKGNTVWNKDGRSEVLTTLDALITLLTSLGGRIGKIGGLREWVEEIWHGHEADFEYLGTQLGYLGTGIGKFNAGLKAEGGFDAASTTSALGAIDYIIGIIQKMRTFGDTFYTVTEGINKYDTPLRMENLSEWVARMADLMRYMANSTTVNSNAPSIITSLVDFIWGFDDALNERGGLKNLQSPEVLENLTQSLVNMVTTVKGLTLEDGTMVDFTIIGTQICNGVIKGIEEGQSAVSITAANMAIAAYNAAMAAIDAHSPSRLFANMGGFIAAGLSMGIENGTGTVIGSSEAMANGAIQSASGIIGMMGQMLNDDLDANPTISPVLDLTGFNAGVGQMQNALDNNGMTIDTSVVGQYATSNLPNRSTQEINQNGSDYSGIYDRIEQAVTQVEELGKQISKMKLVLDSGVVAGGVSDGVDEHIGRQMFYASRNN